MLYYLVYLVSLLPYKILFVISSFFRFVLCNVFGYRYAVIIQNLSRSFPTMTYGDVQDLARRYYKYMFTIIPQIIKLVSVSETKLLNSVTVENIEAVNSNQMSDKNIIIALGHYGNWEILTILPQIINHPVYALYSKIDNSWVDKLMNKIRTRFGVKMLEMTKATKFILKNKENPSAYIFLSDQSAPPTGKVYKFMNQDSYVFSGMDFFASKTHAKVIYTEITYTAKGYNIKFVPVNSDDVTAEYLKLLEQSITDKPEYWLWSHKRWKRYPPQKTN